jgi:hypothetical protein
LSSEPPEDDVAAAAKDEMQEVLDEVGEAGEGEERREEQELQQGRWESTNDDESCSAFFVSRIPQVGHEKINAKNSNDWRQN